jgi:hypothetical protein
MLSRIFSIILITFNRFQTDPILEIFLKYIQNNHKSLEIRNDILKNLTDIDKIMTAFLFLSYQTRHFKNHYISMNNDSNVQFLY